MTLWWGEKTAGAGQRGGSWTSFHSDLVKETRTYAQGLLRCDERGDEQRAARRAPQWSFMSRMPLFLVIMCKVVNHHPLWYGCFVVVRASRRSWFNEEGP